MEVVSKKGILNHNEVLPNANPSRSLSFIMFQFHLDKISLEKVLVERAR